MTNMPSSVDPDETMRLAVERFRVKMQSSYRQFLQDRVEEIEAMSLPTEEEKLNKMSDYYNDYGLGGLSKWHELAPPEMVRQDREARAVTRLQDVETESFRQDFRPRNGVKCVWM